MLYPWLESAYANLFRSYKHGQYMTLLLSGAEYAGRSDLVHELISALLCLNPVKQRACGGCSSCKLEFLTNHPDYYCLAEVAEDGTCLPPKVEQIRAMSEFAYKSPHLSLVKVINLPVADQLSLNSANALLKILEEPPGACVFILQASNLRRVLATITSRAFKYQLPRPDRQLAQSQLANIADGAFWLNYFEGEPLFEPPLTTSELRLFEQVLTKPSLEQIFALSSELDLKKQGLYHLSLLLLKWLSDLSQAKFGQPLTYYQQLSQAIKPLLPRLNLDKLFTLVDEVSFIHTWSRHPLNYKLQLENLLLRYQQLYV